MQKMVKKDVWLQRGTHVQRSVGHFCRYLACLVTRRQECMHFYVIPDTWVAECMHFYVIPATWLSKTL